MNLMLWKWVPGPGFVEYDGGLKLLEPGAVGQNLGI